MLYQDLNDDYRVATLTNQRGSDLSQLARFTKEHKPALILTGAGISTDSGIPAYRDDNGQWIHTKPVQAAEFYANASVRKRYWLRSMLGWPRIQSALPNKTHHVITWLEEHQLTRCIVTQNVDNLHQQAHSKEIVDLHGNLQSVVCLHCESLMPRQDIQASLQKVNPDIDSSGASIGPDGDAVTSNLDQHLEDFTVVDCPHCGGILKPDVVFFGENVPTERVSYCMSQLDRSSMLICIGTSLTVFSGFRFCRAAKEKNIPIALINKGKTRADELADFIINTNCTSALEQLQNQLK